MGFGIWVLGFALLASSSSGCGKKGPPLPPLVPIPAAVELIEADRVGSDVFVTLRIPAQNVDEFEPADLGRVEIYGYTGRTPPPRSLWAEFGTLVATVPVAPPAPQPGENSDSAPGADKHVGAPVQGSSVTIRDTLTPDEVVQGKVRSPEPRSRNPGPGTALPNPESEIGNPEPPLRRFYAALPFNVRGSPGPPGEVAEFALLPAPDSPPAVHVTYNTAAIVVSWEPAGGLIGFLLGRTLPEEPPPLFEEERKEAPGAPSEDLAGPVMYNVYRDILSDPLAPPRPDGQGGQEGWRAEAPTPINPAPLLTLEFTDSLDFGRRRCYSVRSVRGAGTSARIGDASLPACVTPIDTFAPVAPHSLAAVASEGIVSLIWEPNTELDLAGYVVLRGEAADDPLQPLTTTPVREARYRDDTVKPGTRYVYAVVAVDNRFPIPNVSPESNRVEETAR